MSGTPGWATIERRCWPPWCSTRSCWSTTESRAMAMRRSNGYLICFELSDGLNLLSVVAQRQEAFRSLRPVAQTLGLVPDLLWLRHHGQQVLQQHVLNG